MRSASLAVAVTNITLRRPGRSSRPILDGVSFMVPRGQIVSLIGLNGAGKTSLLKIMAGLSFANRGSVTIFGQTSLNPDCRSKLGYMPEQPGFLPALNGWQWLLFTGGMLGLDHRESKRRARQWLEAVGLWPDRHQPIRVYSKGMRQRLAFAQAVLNDPPLLLLDEPLDGLDPIGRQDLKKLILAARDKGTTVILCSHILSDIAELSDRLGILDQGRLRYFGETKDFHAKRNLEAAFVKYIRKS